MDCGDFWGPLLGQSAHLARERMGARLHRLEITPAQTHALLYLGKQGGSASQAELTEFMRLKAPTVNGILDRMEEKELLERQGDPRDGRRKLVTLTGKGRGLLEQTHLAFAEAEQVMRSGFTMEEQAQLRILLERLLQNLKEDRDLC